MAQITYANKSTMNSNSNIPATNKCQASDMNEIKSVVNANYDEMLNTIFYKSGDTMTMGSRYYVNGTLTSSSKNIVFEVPVDKSMKNVSPTLSSIAFNGRTPAGGYINNSSNDITQSSSGYTFTLDKTGDYFIRITVAKSTAFTNVTNNTPVALNVVYTINFS